MSIIFTQIENVWPQNPFHIFHAAQDSGIAGWYDSPPPHKKAPTGDNRTGQEIEG